MTLPPQGTGHALPEEYATVYPVELNTSKAVVPARDMKEIVSRMAEAKRSEEQWVVHSLEKLDEESVTSGDTLAWGAFHASAQTEEDPPALTALLPLFYEKAATPAMVKHGMDVIRQAVTFLNPGQVPIITVDQPLFALAKMVQWKWPVSHGEQAYICSYAWWPAYRDGPMECAWRFA